MSDQYEADKKALTLSAGESTRVDDRLNVRLTSTSTTAPPLAAYTIILETDNNEVQLAFTRNGYEPTLDQPALSLAEALEHLGDTLSAGGVRQPSRATLPIIAVGPDEGPYPVEGTIKIERGGVVIADETVSILEPEDE